MGSRRNHCADGATSTTTDSHGCEHDGCASDDDCPDGSCVNGTCHAVPGQCHVIGCA